MKASENPFPNILFDEQASDIATPAADRWVLFAKSGGIYARNAAGTVVGPFASSVGAPAYVGAKAYHAATQSINNVTATLVSLNSEEFDTDTFHDTATNNSRLTIPTGKGGKYLLTAGIKFASSATVGGRYAWLLKNGTTTLRTGVNTPNPTNTDPGLSLSVVADLVATDYVEIQVYQSSGGALNIGHATAPENQCSFSATLLGT